MVIMIIILIMIVTTITIPIPQVTTNSLNTREIQGFPKSLSILQNGNNEHNVEMPSTLTP